jgi:hypothetical protein
MKSKHEQSDASKNKIQKRKFRRGRATFKRAHVKKGRTKENPTTEQSEGPKSNCSFYVGYLGTLARGATPPEECSTCPDGAVCTIVPKKPGTRARARKSKKSKKTKKDRVKITHNPTRKNTKESRTKRGRTKKKTRVKSPS